jgi:hypothetical protein
LKREAGRFAGSGGAGAERRDRVRGGYPPFGVREAGGNTSDPLDLYCREASEIDLLWTTIGTAPAGTYALAAYYGRLFALAGPTATSPVLYWRAAVPAIDSPYREPTLLMLSGWTFALGRLAGNGDFEGTGAGSLDFTYTHVTRANDGLVFFYHGGNGSAVVVRFNADGTYTKLKTYGQGAFGLWTHVVYVRAGRRVWTDLSAVKEMVLFYNSGGSLAYIGHFDPSNGNFVTDWYSSAFSTGWTHITCTYKGDLLFYNSTNGHYAWGSVENSGAYVNDGDGWGWPSGANAWNTIVPAGHTYLLLYRNNGTAEVGELWNGYGFLYSTTLPASRIVASSSNGVVIAYDPANQGSTWVYGYSAVSQSGQREYPRFAFASGWQQIVGIGIV